MRRLKQYIFLWALLTLPLAGSAQEALKYRWDLNSISDSLGEKLDLTTTSFDFLEISEADSFRYTLPYKNLPEGRGKIVFKGNDTLLFYHHYPNDTLRTFELTALNDSTLVLKESANVFTFTKTNPTLTPTTLNYDFTQSGLSISSVLRGILGLFVLVVISFLCSKHKQHINWKQVSIGLLIQLIFAYAILKISWVASLFDFLSNLFVSLLSFTEAGATFLFGSLITDTTSLGYIFAFQVLPTVIFFSAVTSLLFYWGILQKIVFAFAWVMKRTMGLSGAESLAAAGNIFLGQTESPLLVKPYINKMTKSELLCLMSGGMATIAGGVLAAYINFLGVDEFGNPDVALKIFFAKQLLAASVMSAPAAIVAAKLILPEMEKFNTSMKIEKAKIGSNALEALSNGTTDGLKLAVNVGAMLLVFLAVIALVNSIFGWAGAPHQLVVGESIWINYPGFNDWVASISNGRYSEFSLQFVLGYTLAPITWLMGVDTKDMVLVGQLLGEKTILNEFVAYVSLGEMKTAGAFSSPKSIVIATYILCGFSNFASIGIQIGGIGSLAPSRKADLSKLGFRALLGGTLASLFTAVIVGMLI